MHFPLGRVWCFTQCLSGSCSWKTFSPQASAVETLRILFLRLSNSVFGFSQLHMFVSTQPIRYEFYTYRTTHNSWLQCCSLLSKSNLLLVNSHTVLRKLHPDCSFCHVCNFFFFFPLPSHTPFAFLRVRPTSGLKMYMTPKLNLYVCTFPHKLLQTRAPSQGERP